MINELQVRITYTDGREPRESHWFSLGWLNFRILGQVFGDDFWELLVASVLPLPLADSGNDHMEIIRSLIEDEVKRQVAGR